MPQPSLPTRVTVRYWASARSAAGVESDLLAGSSIAEVLELAQREHPALTRVLTVASVLLDGRAVPRDCPVRDGSVLEILPPFAGG